MGRNICDASTIKPLVTLRVPVLPLDDARLLLKLPAITTQPEHQPLTTLRVKPEIRPVTRPEYRHRRDLLPTVETLPTRLQYPRFLVTLTPYLDTHHPPKPLLKITERVFSEQPLKKRNRKLGTDIATSEPDTEADGAATEAGFQMLTGAAE